MSHANEMILPSRVLGRTGLTIPPIALGCGPVSQLMTVSESPLQTQVFQHAVSVGVRWFDTAPTYGAGLSELNLGRELQRTVSHKRPYVATKVRLQSKDLASISQSIRLSIQGSLDRLGVERVTLLQLHNSITKNRDDLPTSITPEDVLGQGGVVETLRALQRDGLIQFLGMTANGDPKSLQQVVGSGAFDVMQLPLHLLNPSALQGMSGLPLGQDQGELLSLAAKQDMGVLAIRVYAGGALLDLEPSPHTQKSSFYPLKLYEQDRARARQLAADWGGWGRVQDAAIRWVLQQSEVTAAIVGVGCAEHLDLAIQSGGRGPVSVERIKSLERVWGASSGGTVPRCQSFPRH